MSNSVYRDFAIVNDDLAEQIGNKQTMFVMQAFVTDKRGADTAQVKKALKKTIKKYYTIVVFDRDEYKSTMSSMIDQMLMVLYALLALSIIIAIFGIVNTLALSVSERHVARCVACLASKRRSSPCSARCWVWSSASPREW